MRKVLYLFAHLGDRDISYLAGAGQAQQVAAGTVLIKEGQATEALYILLDGELDVAVSKIGSIARLGAGEIVGEMSFVSSTVPSATVSAVGECKIYSISRKTLLGHLERNAEFASRFYYALALFLADRLRGSIQRLGYGKRTEPEPDLSDAELDPVLLEKVAIAGLHFERFVDLLAGR